jgi:hypothetical protein
MSINPNDPVVAMLKEVVGQYDAKLTDLADAVELMMAGTSQALAHLKSRILVLEALVNVNVVDTEETVVQDNGSGREL